MNKYYKNILPVEGGIPRQSEWAILRRDSHSLLRGNGPIRIYSDPTQKVTWNISVMNRRERET
jgi:hypothetical protein